MNSIKICIGLLMALLLSSCSTYYYSTLSSADQVGSRTREGDFIQQNDTATVIYSFFGENAPVHITIYNKLDEPLYVDWARSAIIIDGKATSYAGEDVLSDDDDMRFSSSHVEMIPPYSMIQRQPLTLADFSFHKIPNKEYRKIKYPDEAGKQLNLLVKDYDIDDCPLYFRSYITLYTSGKEQTLPQGLTFDRSFYLSRLIKAGQLSPGNFEPAIQKMGDTFYVKRTKGSEFGYAVLSVVVIAGAIAVEVAVDSNEKY